MAVSRDEEGGESDRISSMVERLATLADREECDRERGLRMHRWSSPERDFLVVFRCSGVGRLRVSSSRGLVLKRPELKSPGRARKTAVEPEPVRDRLRGRADHIAMPRPDCSRDRILVRAWSRRDREAMKVPASRRAQQAPAPPSSERTDLAKSSAASAAPLVVATQERPRSQTGRSSLHRFR